MGEALAEGDGEGDFEGEALLGVGDGEGAGLEPQPADQRLTARHSARADLVHGLASKSLSIPYLPRCLDVLQDRLIAILATGRGNQVLLVHTPILTDPQAHTRHSAGPAEKETPELKDFFPLYRSNALLLDAKSSKRGSTRGRLIVSWVAERPTSTRQDSAAAWHPRRPSGVPRSTSRSLSSGPRWLSGE